MEEITEITKESLSSNLQEKLYKEMSSVPYAVAKNILNNVSNMLKEDKFAEALFTALYNTAHWYVTECTNDVDGLNSNIQNLSEEYRDVYAVMMFLYDLDNGGLKQWIQNKHCRDINRILDIVKHNSLVFDIFEEIKYHLNHKAIKEWDNGIISVCENSFWRKVENLNNGEIEEIVAPEKELAVLEKALKTHATERFFHIQLLRSNASSDGMIATAQDYKPEYPIHEYIQFQQPTIKNMEIVCIAYLHEELTKCD